jgi:hypothetical protein
LKTLKTFQKLKEKELKITEIKQKQKKDYLKKKEELH